MARTVATLPVGNRITDFISLGVIAKTFPVDKVHAILRATGKTSVRQRAGPYAAWMGALASTARRGGSADRRPDDAGRLVQVLAVGQHRRQHARCRRRSGQR